VLYIEILHLYRNEIK